jgi:hypothetical protein
VSVVDVNDNAPEFVSAVVRAVVPEELFPPFKVAEVHAADKDKVSTASVTRTVFYRNVILVVFYYFKMI